jgi:hypothetical protein
MQEKQGCAYRFNADAALSFHFEMRLDVSSIGAMLQTENRSLNRLKIERDDTAHAREMIRLSESKQYGSPGAPIALSGRTY